MLQTSVAMTITIYHSTISQNSFSAPAAQSTMHLVSQLFLF